MEYFVSQYLTSRDIAFKILLIETFSIFQEMYCNDLTFACPTKDDFDFFDADGNGILTWSEWKTLLG